MNKYLFLVEKPCKLTKFLYDKNLKPSQVTKLFKNKDIKVDGQRKTCDCFLEAGQEVVLFLAQQLNKKFEIFYEDENIIIVNKFEGIEVVGNNGLEGEIKGAIAVHRLDRNTKGLVIMAKNLESEQALNKAFRLKSITKKYLCEVVNKTDFEGDTYQAYLFKDAKKSICYVYDEPKPHTVTIKTKFKTIFCGAKTSIVECELVTGKTHQIRAHLAHLKHPIIGDGKYGNNEDNKFFGEKTQKLFCYYIKFSDLLEPLAYLNDKEFKLYPDWFKGKVINN